MDIHILFPILSKNQINDRYTDPSSVSNAQLVQREQGLTFRLHKRININYKKINN